MTTDELTTQVQTTAPPVGEGRSWPNVAVGAATALLASAQHAAATPARRSADRAAALRALTRRRIAELAERGAAEQLRGRRRAAELMDTLATSVAASSVVDRMVDVQVDRILRPLVIAVLDDVLLMLEAEPERVQSLIRGQRESMVDELLDRIRSGAAAGDAVVDRLTARVLHRTVQSPSTPVSAAPPP